MKKLFSLFTCLLAIYSLSAQNQTDIGPNENGVWVMVDEVPLFPGCEDLPTLDERKACANEKLMNFIKNELQYPEEARTNNIEGTVVIMILVQEDGFPGDAKVARGLGFGLDEEALRVVTRMQEEGIFWNPAKYKGKSVKAPYNIPVKFKL